MTLFYVLCLLGALTSVFLLWPTYAMVRYGGGPCGVGDYPFQALPLMGVIGIVMGLVHVHEMTVLKAMDPQQAALTLITKGRGVYGAPRWRSA